MTQDVVFTREQHIGLMTLNRPKALNALTLPMIMAMQQQLSAWEEDDEIHAVVLRAAESKAFCAGGDVRWLYDAGINKNPQQMEFFEHEYRLNQFIHDYSKPYIALMDGVTMGGGVGISLHGSHAVATERFVFAMPETTIGFFPDIGASYLLSGCPDNFGTYLGLTGNRLNAREAQEVNLLNHVLHSSDIPHVIHALLALDLSSGSFAKVTDCLQTFSAPELSSSLPLLQAQMMPCFGVDKMEKVIELLQQAHQHDMVTSLMKKSPLSLKVTLKQLKRAQHLSLTDCLSMDLGLAKHFMRDHDFYEGVRALLVDKDKSPIWCPNTLVATTDEMVDQYFS